MLNMGQGAMVGEDETWKKLEDLINIGRED
jgi:hypothetical protein